MSYILEALRKSEAERRQGQAPDLGQPVQMVYKPRRKPLPLAFWLTLVLVLNAGVLGYVFWPEIRAGFVAAPAQTARVPASPEVEPAPEKNAAPQVNPAPVNEVNSPVQETSSAGVSGAGRTQEMAETPTEEQPTIIVPRPASQRELTPTQPQGRVPHLVELPLSFQKSIPDLTFNSHIVSSNPLASSVMINNQYLRVGDRLGDILVERINEDSVVFSQGGQLFRIGTTRNWMSPR
ncbi:general secretion pathway protein GspB [Marinobacter nauticus]